MLEDADFFQSFQVFDDEREAYGPILRGDAIADLLHVAFTIHEVKRLIAVLVALAPQALEFKKFWRWESRGLYAICDIVDV